MPIASCPLPDALKPPIYVYIPKQLTLKDFNLMRNAIITLPGEIETNL